MGTLGGNYSYAKGINDLGIIVGSTGSGGEDSEAGRAFVYSHGLMQDLNNLVDIPSGLRLVSANAINNKGLIVGWGINPRGDPRAFVLTPVPEPTTVTMFLTTLIALRLKRR